MTIILTAPEQRVRRTVSPPESVAPVGWPGKPVFILLVALIVPWTVSFGPVAVSLYRLALIALALPTLIFWLSGKAGRIRAADILLVLFCIWASIATAVVHGPAEAIEPSGILFIETFSAYLVARCYIRTRQDLVAAVKLLFVLVLLLLPLAVMEAVTRQTVTLNLFRLILPSLEGTSTGLRWGLTRVQGPFEHPILFGVFCGGAVALTHLVLGEQVSTGQRWIMTAIVAATATLSLSSGPMATMTVQLGLVGWNWLLAKVHARWHILWAIVLAAYVVLELGSNQSAPQLLTRFAFDPWTAFYRLLIWEYGWGSVMAHPLFGTGFNEWLRPSWMPPSIDMFWLVPAVRYGIPGGGLFLLAFFAAVLAVSLRPCHDQKLVACRTAYLISMTGFHLVGWTVHFWGATYVLFTFLLGSGMWLLDAPQDEAAAPPEPATRSVRRPLRTPSRPGADRYKRKELQ